MELPSTSTSTDPHPAAEEANQLRSRYLEAEKGNQPDGNNTLSEIKSSYGICDRWRSRSQRIASSFAVGGLVEKKRLEGLVVDEEVRDTKLERLFDVLLAFPFPCKRPRCCGHGRVVRGSFALLQLLFLLGSGWMIVMPLMTTLLCQDESTLHYQCPSVQSRLSAANLTSTSDVGTIVCATPMSCLL